LALELIIHLPKKESWWGEIGKLKDILPREKLINSILARQLFLIKRMAIKIG
jgi:hypothetical protein